MSARSVARQHYDDRSRLVRGIDRLASRLWRTVDPLAIAESWAALVPALFTALVGAQRSAVEPADAYLDEVLAEQGLTTAAVGAVNVEALTGVASDGRELGALLNQPSLTTLVALSGGATLGQALASGEAAARMIVGTQVADAGRVADQVAMTARPDATGYRRMLVGGSCSRCVILAGRWYAYNAGFDRHPRCRPGRLRTRTRPRGHQRRHPDRPDGLLPQPDS